MTMGDSKMSQKNTNHFLQMWSCFVIHHNFIQDNSLFRERNCVAASIMIH